MEVCFYVSLEYAHPPKAPLQSLISFLGACPPTGREAMIGAGVLSAVGGESLVLQRCNMSTRGTVQQVLRYGPYQTGKIVLNYESTISGTVALGRLGKGHTFSCGQTWNPLDRLAFHYNHPHTFASSRSAGTHHH